MKPCKIVKFLLATIFVALTPPALAGSMSAELNRTQGELGENFGLTITIEGNVESRLTLPDVDHLTFRQSGTSSQTVIENGQMRQIRSLEFLLIPDKAGDYTIPSIPLEIDGKTESTLPLSFKVLPAGQSNQGSEGSESSENNAKSKQGNEGIFITKECDNETPYVGESIACIIRIFHRGNLTGGKPENQSSADVRRFNVEGERRYLKQVNGQRYEVIELKEIVVPTKAGDIEVAPFVLQANVIQWNRRNSTLNKLFDSFGSGAFNFGMAEEKEVKIASEPFGLHVKPQPQQGQPADYKGIVGDFQLEVQVNKRQVKAHETVNINIALKGQGLLDTIEAPSLDLSPLGRIYADKPEYKEKVNADGIFSSKTFRLALVPNKEGQYELGSLNIPIFNPKTGEYKILQSDLGTLIVDAAAAEEQPLVVAGKGENSGPAGQRDVEVVGKDLIGPHREVSLLSSHNLSRPLQFVLGTAAGMPAGLALLAFGFTTLRNRRRGEFNTKRLRPGEALRQLSQKLTEAQELAKQGLSSEAADLLHRGWRTYMGEALHLKGQALTDQEIAAKLEERGFKADTLTALRQLAARLEELQFSKGQPASAAIVSLASRISALAEEIEKQC